MKKLQIFTTGLQFKPNMTRSIQKLLYHVTIFTVFIFLTGESFGWGTCIFIGVGDSGASDNLWLPCRNYASLTESCTLIYVGNRYYTVIHTWKFWLSFSARQTVRQAGSSLSSIFSDIFTNWKQWVMGPTKSEKYGSSVEFMGPFRNVLFSE